MSHPITTGNIVMMVLGVLLVLSGPYIIYRTFLGVMEARKQSANARLFGFSNAINLLIAVVFFVAGILFIRNNLRGNPLAGTETTPATTEIIAP